MHPMSVMIFEKFYLMTNSTGDGSDHFNRGKDMNVNTVSAAGKSGLMIS